MGSTSLGGYIMIRGLKSDNRLSPWLSVAVDEAPGILRPLKRAGTRKLAFAPQAYAWGYRLSPAEAGCNAGNGFRSPRLTPGATVCRPLKRACQARFSQQGVNVVSQKFDAELGIPKCRSFDSVWPKNRPNVAQDDRSLYMMTAAFIMMTAAFI